MTSRRFLLLCAVFAAGASAQVIEFESSGLKYKALTHNGVTIMVATLHTHVRSIQRLTSSDLQRFASVLGRPAGGFQV